MAYSGSQLGQHLIATSSPYNNSKSNSKLQDTHREGWTAHAETKAAWVCQSAALVGSGGCTGRTAGDTGRGYWILDTAGKHTGSGLRRKSASKKPRASSLQDLSILSDVRVIPRRLCIQNMGDDQAIQICPSPCVEVCHRLHPCVGAHLCTPPCASPSKEIIQSVLKSKLPLTTKFISWTPSPTWLASSKNLLYPSHHAWVCLRPQTWRRRAPLSF